MLYVAQRKVSVPVRHFLCLNSNTLQLDRASCFSRALNWQTHTLYWLKNCDKQKECSITFETWLHLTFSGLSNTCDCLIFLKFLNFFKYISVKIWGIYLATTTNFCNVWASNLQNMIESVLTFYFCKANMSCVHRIQPLQLCNVVTVVISPVLEFNLKHHVSVVLQLVCLWVEPLKINIEEFMSTETSDLSKHI